MIIEGKGYMVVDSKVEWSCDGCDFDIEGHRYCRENSLVSMCDSKDEDGIHRDGILVEVEDGSDGVEHYNKGSIEVIEAIEDWELGFNLGNVIKYTARAGKKGSDTKEKDLRKAISYLNRELTGKW